MNRTVVHLVYSLGCGGLEQVIVNLINNSKDYDIEHIIITLVNVQDLYENLTQKIKIFSLNKGPGSDISSHFALYKLLKKLKPDVLNTYNFGAIEYQFTGFLAGVKTRIHCDHGHGGDDSSGSSKKRILVRRIISYFLSKYVVVSPNLLKWGKETIGLKSDKIQLVFNGVDTEKYIPGKDKYNKFTICTVGRADPIKNQSLLINAYKVLCDTHSDFKNTQLLIVGDGPIFNELQEEVTELNMDSSINLLGYRNDIDDIMKKSHLFVLSSNYEAMPMTILEAMACDLPVICTDVGGVRYLVSEDVGWLVPKNDVHAMADAINLAFRDQVASSIKSVKGRKMVASKFSINKMVDEYLILYGVDIKNKM
ncbi:MAG: glycosyltransferase [Pseudomonadota bacterium]